jgi:hypothetical protein
VSLPFGGLISRVPIMAKVLLCDIEPTIKIYGKLLAINIVKSKVMIYKKMSHPEKSTSS